jgi:hypothetical protein
MINVPVWTSVAVRITQLEGGASRRLRVIGWVQSRVELKKSTRYEWRVGESDDKRAAVLKSAVSWAFVSGGRYGEVIVA